jgi:hypothetical protein
VEHLERTQPQHDIQAQFHVKSYKLACVTFVNLEDTTSAASPFPNETGYVTDISVTKGS